MRRYDLISEICDGMLELGWKPYQNDHEDANGQFEMNWSYDDALVTADRHAFFKYMVKSIAENHGFRASFSNPTVNSYKRINSPVTLSGATWSPNTISYSGNNRTHMIRIPDFDRFELRLPDGAANPYLLPAAIIAAGLNGIEEKIAPGDRANNNNYTDPLPSEKAPKLPANLLAALQSLESDRVLKTALGESLIAI